MASLVLFTDERKQAYAVGGIASTGSRCKPCETPPSPLKTPLSNRGIELASADGFQQFLITAVDVSFTRSTVDALLAFGDAYPQVDIWSSAAQDDPSDPALKSVPHCDFSCFMLRDSTIQRHGWFDREFKPA